MATLVCFISCFRSWTQLLWGFSCPGSGPAFLMQLYSLEPEYKCLVSQEVLLRSRISPLGCVQAMLHVLICGSCSSFPILNLVLTCFSALMLNVSSLGICLKSGLLAILGLQSNVWVVRGCRRGFCEQSPCQIRASSSCPKRDPPLAKDEP